MSAPTIIIALDGPLGSGKSTVALRLARHFRLPCLDTGAMYRTVALKALEDEVSLETEKELEVIAQKLEFDFEFQGEKLVVRYSYDGGLWKEAGAEIRTPEISQAASKVAQFSRVRKILVKQQQEIGRRKGAVVEGRDAGTVIFPQATVKFFITASPEERAGRRHRELAAKLGDQAPTFESVFKEMVERDRRDEERADSPTKAAPDATVVDTSKKSLDEVVDDLIHQVQNKMN